MFLNQLSQYPLIYAKNLIVTLNGSILRHFMKSRKNFELKMNKHAA
jgi:hypothetical protein